MVAGEVSLHAIVPRRPLKVLIADDKHAGIVRYKDIIDRLRANFQELKNRFGEDILIPDIEAYYSRSLDIDYTDRLESGEIDADSKPVYQWVQEDRITFDVVITDLKFANGEILGHNTTGLEIINYVSKRQRATFQPIVVLITAYEEHMTEAGRESWLPLFGNQYLDPRNFIGHDFFEDFSYVQARIETALSEAEVKRLVREAVFTHPYKFSLLITGQNLQPGDVRRRPRPAQMPPPPPAGEPMSVYIGHRVSGAGIIFAVENPDQKQFLWVLAHNPEVRLPFADIQSLLRNSMGPDAPRQAIYTEGKTIANDLRNIIKRHSERSQATKRYMPVPINAHLCSASNDEVGRNLSLCLRSGHYNPSLPICPCCVLSTRRKSGFSILAPKNHTHIVEIHDVATQTRIYQDRYYR